MWRILKGFLPVTANPADGSFTIIFCQDITIRQRIFLAVPSVWMDRKRELVVAFVLPQCMVPCTF